MKFNTGKRNILGKDVSRETYQRVKGEFVRGRRRGGERLENIEVNKNGEKDFSRMGEEKRGEKTEK